MENNSFVVKRMLQKDFFFSTKELERSITEEKNKYRKKICFSAEITVYKIFKNRFLIKRFYKPSIDDDTRFHTLYISLGRRKPKIY